MKTLLDSITQDGTLDAMLDIMRRYSGDFSPTFGEKLIDKFLPHVPQSSRADRLDILSAMERLS